MKKTNIIVAITEDTRGIGFENNLLYQIESDMKRFVETTVGHTVIMGRKTWESIPEKFRPLKNRHNIVITRQEGFLAPGAEVHHSLEDALSVAKAFPDREIFIIGGGKIYKEALPYAERLYLTLIKGDKPADAFFPEYTEFSKIVDQSDIFHDEKNNIDFYYLTLKK